MGVYIEYDKSLNEWHIFGSYGQGFYKTEEEAREVYGKLIKKFHESEINRSNSGRAWI